jgi:hypothetical protein
MSSGVTPFAGYRGRRHHYSHNWSWAGPEAAIARHRAAQRARWRNSAIRTIADAARPAHYLSPTLTAHFRRVDQHGKVFGPRLQLTGERWMYRNQDVLVAQDDRGRTHSLKTGCRIRVVKRQPEDPHSAACRALKAQWRISRNDNN